MKDKYQEALERAKSYYPDNLFLDTIFPELHDSEDERIRKEIIDHLVREVGLYPGVDREEHKWLRWLEKQKGNPKTANSIPADCASNAKCEDRGEIPQEFIDFLGARYQSMDTYYSDCSALAKMDAPSLWAIAAKYFKEVNPPAPYDDEKQKEQKPEWSEEDEETMKGIMQCIFDNVVNIGTVNKIIYVDWLKSLRPQPKQEWSDEEVKKAAEDYADEFPGMMHENDGSTIEDYDKPYNDFLAGVLWAKHRGIFQNGNTHWKPSEEQMEALKRAADNADEFDGITLLQLAQDLKKLM